MWTFIYIPTSATNFIGFSAHITADVFVSEDATVIFNNALLNVGIGSGQPYDTATGVFTAPLAGYYYFGVTVFSGDSMVNLQFVKGGSTQYTAFADTDVSLLLHYIFNKLNKEAKNRISPIYINNLICS